MNDNHWYPRDPQRYLTDTQWCDHATEVAHNRMIETYYALGRPIKDDQTRLQNIGKIKDSDFMRVRGNLFELGWRVENGEWRHKRIEDTMHNMEEKRLAQVNRTEAARKAALASKSSVTDPVTEHVTQTATGVQPQPQPQQEKEKKEIESVASHPPYSEIFEQWNATGPVKCLVVSDKRRRHIANRWNDPFFKAHWQQAIAMISKSPFCCGENDRGWRASFDWFIQPDTVAKVIEGKYSKAKPKIRIAV